MDQNSEKIKILIDYCFQNDEENYNLINITNFDYYLETGLIKQIESDSKKFILNFESNFLNEEFLKNIELELNKKLPSQLELALSYVDEFEKHLTENYKVIDTNINLTNYKILFKPFVINKFQYDSIEEYYTSLLKNKKIDRNKKNDFIEIFFKYLEVYNSNEEAILNSCSKYYKSEKYPSNYIFNILSNIAKTNHFVAKKLVDYIFYKKENDYENFLPVLLINLFNTNYTEAFDIAISKIKSNPIIAFKALCGFNYKDANQINQIFIELQQLEVNSVDHAKLKSQLLCNIITNDNTDVALKEKSFKEVVELLKSENHDFSHSTFTNVQYGLKDFENEKYYLLNIYLNNTKNFLVLRDFFYDFKNPIFLYRLLISNYDIAGFRGSIDIFENAINHFYDVSREQFEDELLNLFSYRQYSLLALKIILSNRSISFNIDLNRLDKQAQINAIDSICIFPHSIDDLIPMLLKIRNSKIEESKEHLNRKLSELIFEVYHESLLELIKNNITESKSDKMFIEPLQKALDDYNKIKTLKKNIKDLDPTENQRNLMELYYRLEHENQAQMMKNVNNNSNSFLSMTKTMVIVRGRAFKSEDSEEVTPLGFFESSIMIDNRAYKNPNNFEQNLENF